MAKRPIYKIGGFIRQIFDFKFNECLKIWIVLCVTKTLRGILLTFYQPNHNLSRIISSRYPGPVQLNYSHVL